MSKRHNREKVSCWIFEVIVQLETFGRIQILYFIVIDFVFLLQINRFLNFEFDKKLADINSPGHNVDEIVAAGENSGDYLKLAKKGGGHQGKIWEFAFIIT